MLSACNISKRYMIYQRPLDRLGDWFRPARARRGHPFWALRDVSFEVAPGDSMGIVGVNGAGKSTLLKILTGTTMPTEGSFDVRGRVSSLLELGTGFHPEFTGRQNIQFNGKMAGLSDEDLAGKFDEILAFSELGEFIDQPVRTYSSGMALRLGFALASSVDPEVMLIDEALAVGDLHFQQKCLRRIRKFQERGVSILFVSHDPALIKNFCTEAILLDAGRMVDRGKPDAVLDYYTALLAEKYREGGKKVTILRPAGEGENGDQKTESATPDDGQPESSQHTVSWDSPPLASSGHRTGNFQGVITSVYLRALGHKGNPNLLTTGSPASVCVRWVALEAIETATVGIAVKDRLGQEIFGVNTCYREMPIGPVEAGTVVEVAFDLTMQLGEGLYSITAAIHAGPDHTTHCYDWVEQALSFQVLPSPADRFTGLCRLDRDLKLHVGRAGERELDFARATRHIAPE